MLGATVQALGLDPHRYPASPAASWPFRLYARGDAGHFLDIARNGYFGPHSDPVSPAYFPGYPLAGRAIAHLFGSTAPSITYYLVSLSVLSWVGTAVAAVLLWKLAAYEGIPSTASASVIAMLAGPYSVFLIASYSEGPFLAFAIGAWIAARCNRWLTAGMLASLAATTRISGLFLACGLVVMFVQDRRSLRAAASDGNMLALALPFLTVLSYFAWLRHHTGSWTTWFEVERIGWGRHLVSPITAFGHSVGRLFTVHATTDWQLAAFAVQDTLEIAFAVAFVIGTVALVRRRRWPEATYVGLTAVTLLTSSYYLSVPRSMLVCFPVWLLIGEGVVRHKSSRLLLIAAASSTAVALWNVSTMLSDHWTG
jgi:hypothetical protein